MASLFDTLQANAFRAGIRTRTKESQAWFKRNVTNLQVSPTSILKDKALDKTAQNIRGNKLLKDLSTTALFGANAKCVGKIADEENNRFYRFIRG